MNSINRKVTAPKRFRANSIISFINDCQDIYRLPGKKEQNFLLDLSKVEECSMIGVLLIYKIIEFSITKQCFYNPMYFMDVPIRAALKKYGFENLILTYLADKKSVRNEFENLKISVTNEFIIAPQALLRNDKYSSEILNKNYLPQIEKYYLGQLKAVSMIFTCFSEILLNFWEHAVDDTQSIIVANGNKTNIEIACADNGKGVISSLSLAGKERKNGIETLKSAVDKGVTSKDMSNHMGYGLWIIDEISKRTNGRFHLYSEGYYYQREFNKIASGKCGFWQGTIVYLSIPLKNPITLFDIENPFDNIAQNIKINWS
jgi:hypothetical protein